MTARAVGGAPSVDPRVQKRIDDIRCGLAGYGSDKGFRAVHLRTSLDAIHDQRRRISLGIARTCDLSAEALTQVEVWLVDELTALEAEIAEGLRLARAL